MKSERYTYPVRGKFRFFFTSFAPLFHCTSSRRSYLKSSFCVLNFFASLLAYRGARRTISWRTKKDFFVMQIFYRLFQHSMVQWKGLLWGKKKETWLSSDVKPLHGLVETERIARTVRNAIQLFECGVKRAFERDWDCKKCKLRWKKWRMGDKEISRCTALSVFESSFFEKRNRDGTLFYFRTGLVS